MGGAAAFHENERIIAVALLPEICFEGVVVVAVALTKVPCRAFAVRNLCHYFAVTPGRCGGSASVSAVIVNTVRRSSFLTCQCVLGNFFHVVMEVVDG